MVQNPAWYDKVQTMFGSLSPGYDNPQQAMQHTLMNLGSGMLANANQNPMQALGQGLQYANQAGMSNAYQGQMIKSMQSNAKERERRAALDEETRKRRIQWASLPENANNPIAKAYMGGLLPEESFGDAMVQSMTPQKIDTSITDVGGRRVLVNDQTGDTIRDMGESPTKQQNAPPGYRLNDDGSMSAIPGGPATKLPAEVAGRLAMMRTANKGMPEATKYFLNPPNTKSTELFQYHTNSGDYGRASRTIKVAIESALRAMTGAAAPDSEVASYMDKFLPTPYDYPETRKQKLMLLQSFMDEAQSTIMQGHETGQPADQGGWVEMNGVKVRKKSP